MFLTCSPQLDIRHSATLASAWFASLIWFATTIRQARNRENRTTKWFSLFGLWAMLLHIVISMYLSHGWSLVEAYEFTARQSGVGAGLYVNVAMILLWGIDWYWIGHAKGQTFKRWILAIRLFIAFIVFNATVVFASSWPRYLAFVAFAWLAFDFFRLNLRSSRGQELATNQPTL